MGKGWRSRRGRCGEASYGGPDKGARAGAVVVAGCDGGGAEKTCSGGAGEVCGERGRHVAEREGVKGEGKRITWESLRWGRRQTKGNARVGNDDVARCVHVLIHVDYKFWSYGQFNGHVCKI